MDKQSVAEWVQALQAPDEIFRIPDQTVVGHHKVSKWSHAQQRLIQHLDEARPLLEPLLYSPDPFVKVNALEVFRRDKPERLRKLQGQVIKLLDDPAPRVRIFASHVLSNLNTERAENALLKRLDGLMKGDPKNMYLASERVTTVSALCAHVKNVRKVMPPVAAAITNGRMQESTVWQCIQHSKQLNRHPDSGEGMYAAYWKVMTKTKSDRLAGIAAGGMDSQDARSLPYLLRLNEIRLDGARAEMVRGLMEHREFKEAEHLELVEGFFTDSHDWVRHNAVNGLRRMEEDTAFASLLDHAMRLVSDESLTVRVVATRKLCDLLCYLPAEKRARIRPLLKEDLGEVMAKALRDESLAPNVVYQTHLKCEVEALPEVAEAHWKRYFDE